MKSIIIIIVYFGPFPKQFNFWLESAYDNSTIDYIIFTDNELATKNNVRVVKMSFEELKYTIQTCFDFSISLNNAYKLCDYKPAYGIIFKKYTQNYNFWGYGDIDLVYGNIRNFITDELLNLHEIILGFGHLTLYKNNEYCNHYFKEHINGYLYYKDAFTTEKYYKFDEFFHGGMSDRWKHFHPNLVWDHQPFDDILVPRLAFNFISVFNKHVSSNLIFHYTNKNLYRIYTNEQNEIIKEQTLYAHFQQRGFLSVKTENKNEYIIIPNSYISSEEITIEKIKRWGKAQDIKRVIWNLRNKVKRRLKLIRINLTNTFTHYM